jgi:hypothetical protein
MKTNKKKQKVQLVERHNPECENEFLRFQYGIETLRSLRRPVYAGRVVVGDEPIKAFGTVFHLLGWSSDKARALRMAKDALERLQDGVVEQG